MSRITPGFLKASKIAGARTLVMGGIVCFALGAFGTVSAAVNLGRLATEQALLMAIGAALLAIGFRLPRSLS